MFLDLLNNFKHLNITDWDNLESVFNIGREQIRNITILFFISLVITIVGHNYLLKKKGINYLQYIKIKLLPVSYGLNKKIEKITNKNNKVIKYIWDYIVIKNGRLVVSNLTGVDFKKYNNIIEELEHFLGLKIYKINKLKNGRLELVFKDLLSDVPVLSIGDFKKNKVFFGYGWESGKIYIPLKDLTHFFVVGQSGSGKSVFQNLLINNFIYNLDNLESLILVDLKGGVEFLQYREVNKKIKVITNIEELFKLTRELIKTMNKRYDEMIKKGIKNWEKKQIFVIVDEFVSVRDQSNLLEKSDYKELEKNLRTLLGKSRAAGIKFIISTQKGTSDSIDTTLRENLQSRVLMRTIGREGQKSVVPLEFIDQLGVNPSEFTRGKFILFTENILDVVKSPFVVEDFYKVFLNKK